MKIIHKEDTLNNVQECTECGKKSDILCELLASDVFSEDSVLVCKECVAKAFLLFP